MEQGGFRLDSYAVRDTTLTLQGDYYSGDEDEVTGGTSGVTGENVLGRWSRTFSPDSDMSLQLYADRTHLTDPVPASAFARAGILIDTLNTYDLDFQRRFRLGVNGITWGLGYRRTRDVVVNAPALAFFPPDLSQNLYSGFVQDEVALAKDLALTFGSKLEHNDYTGLEAEPSARLKWDLTPTQMLWTAVSRAVRTPSRVDRDIYEPNPPPAVLEGSSNFKSETVIAYEVGYRAALGPNVSGSLSVFYNDYSDIRSLGYTPVTILPLLFQNSLEGDDLRDGGQRQLAGAVLVAVARRVRPAPGDDPGQAGPGRHQQRAQRDGRSREPILPAFFDGLARPASSSTPPSAGSTRSRSTTAGSRQSLRAMAS